MDATGWMLPAHWLFPGNAQVGSWLSWQDLAPSRTNGRVIFSADCNYKPEDLLKGARPTGLLVKRLKEFIGCLEVDTMYVEYKVEL